MTDLLTRREQLQQAEQHQADNQAGGPAQVVQATGAHQADVVGVLFVQADTPADRATLT